MAVGELLLGLVVVLAALVGSSAPLAAFARTRDPRFLALSGGFLLLLALGALASYGASDSSAPAFARLPTVPLALLAVVAALLVLPSLVPRSRAW